MQRFLFIASYSSDGVKGIVSQGGSARRDAISTSAEKLGGRLLSFDFAFGDADVYTLVELPDQKAAAALSMAVNAIGLTKVKVVVLLSPEDIDEATQRPVTYVAPGRS
ncbi:MAG TPA: GYD domain-containing protein [Pseudonocardiaceae bacterium]|jgi:uncharacterized protein with GYD domain|nr:GYD domain-containing protein [Pseudonocardiaceae bacterium]